MKDLVDIFVRAHCSEVRSYIQSGNIIFRSTDAIAKKIPALVSAEIERQFGFAARLVIRTADQMRNVAESNPFVSAGDSDEFLSVMFLDGSPQQHAIEQLDQQRSPPDRYIVQGDSIFLHTPNGLAKTKLTNAFFDSKLKTFGTGRNWRTVLKLVELMET
jgi:uncharacterized protein (DUF1697 family)